MQTLAVAVAIHTLKDGSVAGEQHSVSACGQGNAKVAPFKDVMNGAVSTTGKSL